MSTISSTEAEKVSLWLKENSVDRTQVGAQLLSAPAVKVGPGESTNMAMSSAVVLGADYKAMDEELKEAMSKEEREAAIQKFKKMPLEGCTTVLNMARVASGYNPNGDMKGANLEKFNDYMRRVMSAPFFHLTMNTHQTLHRQEKNWTEAIKEISDLFTGISEDDKKKIAQSIKNLAVAVASNSNTQQGVTLFAVSALSVSATTIRVYIYTSSISMIEHTSKGSDCKQTDVDIYEVQLEFNTGMWPHYAPLVFGDQLTLIIDWLLGNTTAPSAKKTNLCVGGYQKLD